jgi:hypothetical protein
MSNASDERTPLNRDHVNLAILTEREYQRLVWGYRQSDGQMTEAKHDLYDWLAYVYHYNLQAIAQSANNAGHKHAIIEARKVAALVLAYFAQSGSEPESFLESLTVPAAHGDGRGLNYYLCKTQGLIVNALTMIADGATPADAVVYTLRSILINYVLMFMYFGCPERNLDGLINKRDGLPAK